ncbi:MAG: hypothetical protein GX605_10480, partial [Chloroflexi bacterium]|nr:hypothetical protein [Chloroflexota bacterium]
MRTAFLWRAAWAGLLALLAAAVLFSASPLRAEDAPPLLRLTEGGDAVFVGWGPGGQSVRYVRAGDLAPGQPAPLWQAPLAGGNPSAIGETAAPWDNEQPLRDTDGRLLLDGADDASQTLPPAEAALPVWSPDGRAVAFLGWEEPSRPCLWLWDAAVGSGDCLLQGEREHFGRPDWSPDGQWVVVSRTPAGTETASLSDLWLVP